MISDSRYEVILAKWVTHIMKKQEPHWAYEELEVTLERNDLDRMEIGTLFLVNSEMRTRLDGIIANRLWPAVLAGLHGSAFGIFNQNKIFDDVRTMRSPLLARELVFLIEDPLRPLAPGRARAWHVRGVLEARLDQFLITFDLNLEFPESIDPRWLTDFIKNDLLMAANPRLSFSTEHSDDESSYVLTISTTRAGRYDDGKLGPERIIPESVRRHLDIIWAADLLADQLSEEKDLSEALTERTAGLVDVLTEKLVALRAEW